MNLTPNALRVLESRYLRRSAEGLIVETPDQMFERVSRAVAEAESLLGNARETAFHQAEFLRLLKSLDFLPNTPTLMNAGTPMGQLSGCFVLPVEDTMEGIFESVKQMALVQRTGGGTGFSFSRLRPKGDIVASTGGEASGPVSFMKIFDCVTENIKQGGKRRGANMGILRVDHPDIMEFIRAKLDGRHLQNFNISVGVTDGFMDALEHDARYPLVHPRTGDEAGSLRAREVFEAIVEAAWRTGDPGLIFLDAIERKNPTPHLGSIEATNPCGEIPLLPYESCNLCSINLAHMVAERGGGIVIDWERLGRTVHVVTRFLDNVIAVNKYSLPEIERITRGNRKIGLGVMGFAHLLILLGVSYDSDEAVALADRLMRFIAQAALDASRALAESRGVFPNWKGSVYEAQSIRVRNATRTAIAPTGTISIIAGTSASIEPLFALAYRRKNVLKGETLHEVNLLLLDYLRRHGLDSERVVEGIMEQGSLRSVKGAPDEIKRIFVTALEVPPERHLAIQAAFQAHVDNSVSKTINFPHEATPQDIASVYRRAWELGLKGITIYRYGSKPSQVLELGVGEEANFHDHGSRCDPDECRT
jgi:ribonucleoside-diphosphate reductase alpha chain